MDPKWLDWAKRLRAIAQSGLTFTNDPFEIERYHAVQKIAAEMMSEYSSESMERILDLFAGDTGYATPKLDVRGVVFKDDAILLVRERSDGGWTLPGGWVDVGESPREAVEREVMEESGYRVRAARLLALYDKTKHPHPPSPIHIYKVFILCDFLGGEPVEANLETDGAAFFRENEIPKLSVSRTTSGQITRLFHHHRNPGLPADFD